MDTMGVLSQQHMAAAQAIQRDTCLQNFQLDDVSPPQAGILTQGFLYSYLVPVYRRCNDKVSWCPPRKTPLFLVRYHTQKDYLLWVLLPSIRFLVDPGLQSGRTFYVQASWYLISGNTFLPSCGSNMFSPSCRRGERPVGRGRANEYFSWRSDMSTTYAYCVIRSALLLRRNRTPRDAMTAGGSQLFLRFVALSAFLSRVAGCNVGGLLLYGLRQ